MHKDADVLPSRETSPLSTLTEESLEALDQVGSMPSCCAEYPIGANGIPVGTISGQMKLTFILPHAACLQSNEVAPLKRSTCVKRKHDLNDDSGKQFKKPHVSPVPACALYIRDIPVYSPDKGILCVMCV